MLLWYCLGVFVGFQSNQQMAYFFLLIWTISYLAKVPSLQNHLVTQTTRNMNLFRQCCSLDRFCLAQVVMDMDLLLMIHYFQGSRVICVLPIWWSSCILSSQILGVPHKSCQQLTKSKALVTIFFTQNKYLEFHLPCTSLTQCREGQWCLIMSLHCPWGIFVAPVHVDAGAGGKDAKSLFNQL